MNVRQSCLELGRHSELREVLALHDRARFPWSLPESLGDGVLCATNPVFLQIRRDSQQAGFRYSFHGRRIYTGWSLVALDRILTERVIPYRDNRSGLRHLERSRPGFFRLSDLTHNRPNPNYVLHESAHAVAYCQLFGAPGDSHRVMSEQSSALRVLLGESFAMTAEYLASCCLGSPVEQWFFSINSYRHRTPGKTAVARILESHGPATAQSCVLGAFLFSNFLRASLRASDLNAILRVTDQPILSAKEARDLARSLAEATRMNPGFLHHTNRLFLCSLGFPRNVTAQLAQTNPIRELEADSRALEVWPYLLSSLGLDSKMTSGAISGQS